MEKEFVIGVIVYFNVELVKDSIVAHLHLKLQIVFLDYQINWLIRSVQPLELHRLLKVHEVNLCGLICDIMADRQGFALLTILEDKRELHSFQKLPIHLNFESFRASGYRSAGGVQLLWRMPNE